MSTNQEIGLSVRCDAASKYGIRSIALAFALIEYLAAREPRGTSEIARDLGINKWRVFRHLHALRQEGYVQQDASTDKFSLSTKLFTVAARLPQRLGFVEPARPIMRALQEEIGQTILLSTLADDRMVVIESESGGNSVQVVVLPGAQLDLHASAQGRIALAFGPDDILERILKAQLRARTAQTLTSPAALRREVDLARRRSWAISRGEHRVGFNAAATPVFGRNGEFKAALAITYVNSVDGATLDAYIQSLIVAARRLTSTIGGSPPNFTKKPPFPRETATK